MSEEKPEQATERRKTPQTRPQTRESLKACREQCERLKKRLEKKDGTIDKAFAGLLVTVIGTLGALIVAGANYIVQTYLSQMPK